MKIWHRFLLWPLITMFLFCLCSAFLLYVVVDLSIHGVNFSEEWSGFGELGLYYLKHLSIHWELFATISFLLASLKVLSDAMFNLEWSALQMGGLSSRKLLSPFVLFGTALALLSLVNGEWISPHTGYLSQKKHPQMLHSLTLKDDTELVYRTHEQDQLLDLFWIKSPNEIWHLDALSLTTLIGSHVDLLEIDQGIQSKDYFDELLCAIELPDDWQENQVLALESRPTSSLFSEPTAEGRTYFHRKLAEPFLPLLALLAIAPPLLRFQRRSRLFLITALALLGFFVQFTIFEGVQILGENRVLPPALAIWTPLMLATVIFSWRFKKLV